MRFSSQRPDWTSNELFDTIEDVWDSDDLTLFKSVLGRNIENLRVEAVRVPKLVKQLGSSIIDQFENSLKLDDGTLSMTLHQFLQTKDLRLPFKDILARKSINEIELAKACVRYRQRYMHEFKQVHKWRYLAGKPHVKDANEDIENKIKMADYHYNAILDKKCTKLAELEAFNQACERYRDYSLSMLSREAF